MAEQSEELKSATAKYAREVMLAILKARRNLRLYPSNNPIYAKIIGETFNRFKEFFYHKDVLDLRITRNEIVHDGENVYVSEGKDENLALFFFRDGLRELKFAGGLDQAELEEFLRIISLDFDREFVEDDIVTLLWEKDFKNVSYKVDESVLVEDESYEQKAIAQAKDGACTDESLRQAYDEALRQEEKHEFTVMPITDADLKALVTEVERDADDKVGKLISIIFDMIEQAENKQEYDDLALVLRNCMDFCLRERNLGRVLDILVQARTAHDADTSVDLKRAMSTVLAHVSSPDAVRSLGPLLDSVSGMDEQVFGEYIQLLSPKAIDPFLQLLSEMKTGPGKKRAVMALTSLGKANIDALASGLRDSRPTVLRSVIFIMRQIGDKKGANHLVGLALHEDPMVRKDVLAALGDLGDVKTIPTLQALLDDPEPTVRLTAAKSLGKIGSDYSRDIILGKISEKGIAQLEFGEIKGYFEVLSRWKEPAVAEALLDIVRRKHLFSRSAYANLKAGAIYCLGLMGSREAAPELRKIVESGVEPLSGHARAALKRIEHGQ
jgi:HEAT repeat protein